MAKSRQFRTFDYVNRPYPQVRDALLDGAEEIFRNATRAAASRAYDVASALHVELAGIEIGAEIDITVGRIEERGGIRPSGSTTRVSLEWKAVKHARLFPEMNGELAVYPLTDRETQLDFDGTYTPPLGPLGSAIDAVVGHRIAEASIHRFVTDVTDYLRRSLPER